MAHVRSMSCVPRPAQQGQTTASESIIIVVLSVLFNDWDNFIPVLQNLQKFYSKTPA